MDGLQLMDFLNRKIDVRGRKIYSESGQICEYQFGYADVLSSPVLKTRQELIDAIRRVDKRIVQLMEARTDMLEMIGEKE
jgi:hypothetical protein